MYEEYTDKQIVEMLVPKLEKSTKHDWHDLLEYPSVCKDMVSALALAYRSGYIRGQLGRSFITGEKKSKKVVAWVPANKNNVKIGDKVKIITTICSSFRSGCYPPRGTIGEVVDLDKNCCMVQWPKGTVIGSGRWWANCEKLEVFVCE